MSLTEDINKYITWCNKYGLKKTDPTNLHLFIHKGDMGFIFGDFQEAKENGVFTDQQIAAVEDKEVGSTMENDNTIQIDTKVGTFFLIEAQDEAFAYVVLDSNKQFIGNVYTEYPEEFVEQLKAIEHISDICNLGVCDWMIFATSRNDLLEELNEYIQSNNEKYDEHSSLFTKDDLKYGEYEFYNIVGNNHILVDLD